MKAVHAVADLGRTDWRDAEALRLIDVTLMAGLTFLLIAQLMAARGLLLV